MRNKSLIAFGSHPTAAPTPVALTCLADGEAAGARLDAIAARTGHGQRRQEEEKVAAILEQVRLGGDAALLDLSERFDGVRPQPLRLDSTQLQAAWESTTIELRQALELAHRRILDFHRRQLPADLAVVGPHGEKLGRRWRPVQRAGLYVPGGRAAYPSTVLMNAVPARVAGVERIVMVTPPGPGGAPNPTVMAAAHLCGISEVIQVGGAQAIAALGCPAPLPEDRRVWRPNEVGTVPDPDATLAWMRRIALADGEADPSEVRLLRAYARAWRVDLEDVRMDAPPWWRRLPEIWAKARRTA